MRAGTMWRRTAVLLVLLGTLVGGGSAAVQPASASGCYYYEFDNIAVGGDESVSFVREAEEIQQYESDWQRRRTLSIQNYSTRADLTGDEDQRSLLAIAAGPTGDYWAVASRGQIRRFDPSWNDTGARYRINLSRGTDVKKGRTLETDNVDIARGDGRWWLLIAADRTSQLFAFDDQWNRTNTTREFYYYIAGITGTEEAIYALSGEGERRRLTRTANGTVLEQDRHRADVHRAADLVHRNESRWWVLTDRGELVELDASWNRTGDTRTDLTAGPQCSSGPSGFLILLFLVGRIGVPIVAGLVTYLTYRAVARRAETDTVTATDSAADTGTAPDSAADTGTQTDVPVDRYRQFAIGGVLAGGVLAVFALLPVVGFLLRGPGLVAVALPVSIVAGEAALLAHDGFAITARRLLELVALNLPLVGVALVSLML